MEYSVQRTCIVSDEFKIQTIDGIVVVQFEPGSTISLDTITRAVKLERSNVKRTGVNDIWDIRNSVISDDINFESVNQIINFLQSDEAFLKNSRTAVLVNNDVQYGTTRIFQTLSQELPSTVRIFEEMDDAIKWLKE